MNFYLMQKTQNGRQMDVEQSGRCGCEDDDFLLLVGLEFRATSPNMALLARLIKTVARALAQHRAFELAKDSNYSHSHVPAHRGGVNRLGLAAKACLRLTLKHS